MSMGDGLPVNAQCENALVIESFLSENYRFRRNVLNGKVEFACLEAGVTVGQVPVTSDDRDQSPRHLRGLISPEGFLSLYPDDSWCAGYHGIYGHRKDAT